MTFVFPPAVVIALIVAATWNLSAVQQTCECPVVRQFPAGVADASAGVAFLAAAGSGVSAVQLSSGSILWTTQIASVPIGATADGVVALRRGDDPREVQPMLLDRRTGAPRVAGRSINPGRDLLRGRSLTATLFTVEDEDGIVVRWRDIAADLRGPERGTGRSIGAGGFRLRRDGSVETIAREDVPRDLSRASGVPYQRGSEYTSDPWGEGPCGRSLASEDRGGLLALSICFQPNPPAAEAMRRELAREKSFAATVSLDGCTVFVDPGAAADRTWLIFAAGTGEPLGRVPRDPEAWNPAAIGDAVYYLVDGTTAAGTVGTLLRAIERSTGRRRWEMPVRGRGDSGAGR